MLGDRSELIANLPQRGLEAWGPELEEACQAAFAEDSHGMMPQWQSVWHALPDPTGTRWDSSGAAVAVCGDQDATPDPQVRDLLMAFHPWRKGPFHFLGWDIDTEWRSDWKWNRLAGKVDFRKRWVLDVGCGNGYYGWKMLEAGAGLVLGCDPFLLYLMQFEVFRRYAPPSQLHYVVPLTDVQLPPQMQAFDIALSMGVLYHRTSPIDHLKTMWQTLRPNGTLVLETLVLPGLGYEVLVPEDRYAQMRNVWFLPTIPMLQRWLRRSRFHEIEILDVSRTTVQEQRSTDWMTFQSLADFLDPEDPLKTIEGYPSPVRVLMTAKRQSG